MGVEAKLSRVELMWQSDVNWKLQLFCPVFSGLIFRMIKGKKVPRLIHNVCIV